MLLICQSYPPYLPIIPVVITERGGGKSFQSKKPTGRCDNAEGRNSRDHRTTFRASVSNLTQSVCSICCEVSVCLSSIWSIWTTWSICLSVYLYTWAVCLSDLSIWSIGVSDLSVCSCSVYLSGLSELSDLSDLPNLSLSNPSVCHLIWVTFLIYLPLCLTFLIYLTCPSVFLSMRAV